MFFQHAAGGEIGSVLSVEPPLITDKSETRGFSQGYELIRTDSSSNTWTTKDYFKDIFHEFRWEFHRWSIFKPKISLTGLKIHWFKLTVLSYGTQMVRNAKGYYYGTRSPSDLLVLRCYSFSLGALGIRTSVENPFRNQHHAHTTFVWGLHNANHADSMFIYWFRKQSPPPSGGDFTKIIIKCFSNFSTTQAEILGFALFDWNTILRSIPQPMVSIRSKTFFFGIGNLAIRKSVGNHVDVNWKPKASEAPQQRRCGRAGGTAKQ